MSRTRPGTSQASVTERTATRVATAPRAACHSLESTLAEVTDSGGMANDFPALIIVPIWPALMPASTTTTPNKAAMATIHIRRLLIRIGRCCVPAAISTKPPRSASYDEAPYLIHRRRRVTLDGCLLAMPGSPDGFIRAPIRANPVPPGARFAVHSGGSTGPPDCSGLVTPLSRVRAKNLRHAKPIGGLRPGRGGKGRACRPPVTS